MTPDEFVQILVAESEADGNTTWVQALLDQARAKITAGKGEVAMLTDSTVNGKTFTRRFQFSALETLRACRMALNIVNEADTDVKTSYADFSCINR